MATSSLADLLEDVVLAAAAARAEIRAAGEQPEIDPKDIVLDYTNPGSFGIVHIPTGVAMSVPWGQSNHKTKSDACRALRAAVAAYIKP